MAAKRFLVRGRVQGVGFRAYVRERAEAYGLDGEVWNRQDGSVEAIASGEPELLEAFEADLHNGPGRVGAILADPYPFAIPPGFGIGATR